MTAENLQEGLADTEVPVHRSSVLISIKQLVMMWALTLNIEPWINVNHLPLQPGFQKGEEAVDAAECKHSRRQNIKCSN